MNKTYAMAEIREALGERVNDFDIDAMFEELYQYDDDDYGFVEREDVDFWDVAQKYDMTGEQAEEVWEGEGWYSVEYTDGGMPATNDGPVWCDSINDLAGLFSMANETMTEYHIAYAEFKGSDEEPKEI